MTATTSVAPALSRPAARAWEMLTRAENPIPVYAGLDWCRIESGCEDVRAVKRALYAAAADAIDALAAGEPFQLPRTNPPNYRISVFADGVRDGEFGRAKEASDPELDDDPDGVYFPMWQFAFAALRLCREIESQPE